MIEILIFALGYLIGSTVGFHRGRKHKYWFYIGDNEEKYKSSTIGMLISK